jgi:hypothetical protein
MRSPATRLREHLTWMKQRGAPFGEMMWLHAVEIACRGHEEAEWYRELLLREQRAAWQRAYEGEEMDAMSVLAETVDLRRPNADEVCALPGCDRLLGDTSGRHGNRRYCCEEHQRLANRRREAQKDYAA